MTTMTYRGCFYDRMEGNSPPTRRCDSTHRPGHATWNFDWDWVRGWGYRLQNTASCNSKEASSSQIESLWTTNLDDMALTS